ncbi:MAG: DUF1838 family protein [Pseudomonadota bacterium]
MLKYFLAAAGVCAALSGAKAFAELDPNTSADALQISRKIMCSTVDGEPITYWWEGRAFSRRLGEKDKLLFLVEGMNVRACSAVEDAKRGKGFKLVSREILLYKDPKTGKVLSKWDNPWSGETVDVLHVANDPVNFTMYAKESDGSALKWRGQIKNGLWRQSSTVPLFYKNPLTASYEAEIGGAYHATEMFNFFGDADDLLDPDKTTAKTHVSWERMSDWLPWMKMSGRDGIIYMHTAGLKLNAWDELSDTMKAEIRKHYPEYAGPPPLDDDRRNVTSWSYYKDVSEGVIKAPKR